MTKRNRQAIVWILALLIGGGIGFLNIDSINQAMSIVAKIYTRLFQLLAIPTIAIAVTATMMKMGEEKGMGQMFIKTIRYTLLTTLLAAVVGVAVYYLVAPGNMAESFLNNGDSTGTESGTQGSYLDYLLDTIPDNIVKPFAAGNVLGVLMLAFAFGIGISRLPESDSRQTLKNFVTGAQDLLFMLIRWLIAVLPLGIMAFAAQLVTEVSGGVIMDSIGKYTLVVIAANLLQMLVVLPSFLGIHKVNPFRAMVRMSPALITAFFTKSSAATLPLTISTAESRMNVSPKVARFVLPICTTLNMNGCAAFIAVTSIFVMQNAGIILSLPQIALWVLIAVISAVGNAGVPMGCYFLTVSLVSDVEGAMAIMGIILPIYTIIDMVETCENVWSDSCVAIATDRSMRQRG